VNPTNGQLPCGGDLPRELNKVSMPTYVIETPDVLDINVTRAVPKPPYYIEELDVLLIQIPINQTFPGEPIQGTFSVDPDGTIDLGFRYGKVRVVGLTLDQARDAIIERLEKGVGLAKVTPTVQLGRSRVQQQVRGEHLVRPDGTVSLGTYGSVYVSGLTLAEARQKIEEQLSKFLFKPEIDMEVIGYNSKVYYFIADNPGSGTGVQRVPITGNETVLDAMALVGGFPGQGSKIRVWIARPSPAGSCSDQILPVDWVSIVKCGRVETNYQLLPNDRLYVQAQPLLTFSAILQRVLTPIEQVLGFALFVDAVQFGAGGFGAGFGAGAGAAGFAGF
jgi:polysaccharide export outer membrane protein